MRYALIILLPVVFLVGCRSTPDRCPEIMPVRVFEAEPAYEGEISHDSDDAAIRYVAIAEELFESKWGSPYFIDVQENGIDQFVAFSYETDQISTTDYEQWLQANQSWFEEIENASHIPDYRAYVPHILFAEHSEDEIFIRTSRSTMELCRVLEDDAVRLWAQGDSIAATERIDLVIRVAMQSVRAPAATAITGLSARLLIERALVIYEQMLMSERCGAKEIALIRESVSELEIDDPSMLLRLTATEVASLHHAMKKWLEVEGGSYEIWVLLGRYFGTVAAIQPILDAFESAKEITVERKEIEEDDDPFSWPPEINVDALTIQALSEMVELEYEDLKATHVAISGDVELLLEELCSGKPNIDVLKAIQDKYADDDSPLTMMLYLKLAPTVAKNHARMIEVRDRVVALCEAE